MVQLTLSASLTAGDHEGRPTCVQKRGYTVETAKRDHGNTIAVVVAEVPDQIWANNPTTRALWQIHRNICFQAGPPLDKRTLQLGVW